VSYGIRQPQGIEAVSKHFRVEELDNLEPAVKLGRWPNLESKRRGVANGREGLGWASQQSGGVPGPPRMILQANRIQLFGLRVGRQPIIGVYVSTGTRPRPTIYTVEY
jgi:hypothetical protein